MKPVADLHVHTVASGHAYSTIKENVEVAREKQLELIAITDHGPAMPNGPHLYHFSNMQILPAAIDGVRVLRGIEANIIDAVGSIDISDRYLKYLDIVLAGFHRDCLAPASAEDNTRTLIGAIASGRVDIVVHPGNPVFPIDPVRVAAAAVSHGVLLEINNASLGGVVRRGSRNNCLPLAQAVAKAGGRVALGSDSHYCADVGELDRALALAKSAGLGPDRIINTSLAALNEFLVARGRRGFAI